MTNPIHTSLLISPPQLAYLGKGLWVLIAQRGSASLKVSMWVSESRSVVSDFLQPHGLHSTWNSPGQNTSVGSPSLLQGIFPTQRLNPGLPHCRQILYQLSHEGSPRIQEWVAYIFSSGSSRSSNWTGVSCIAGRFFTNWAIKEAEHQYVVTPKGYAPKPLILTPKITIQ